MREASRAVFLSYASQDAEAAQRICEGLQAAGVEVWLDQSELRGGDAWDLRIRQQIRDCLLFVPIISANTAVRLEGYFRLEWKLAVDRSYLMAAEKPFLLPAVIDATQESNAHVPDRFREVQWTRLPGGQYTQAFVEHVQRLLSGEQDGTPATRGTLVAAAEKAVVPRWRRMAAWLAALLVVTIALGFLGHRLWLSTRGREDAREPSIAVPISAATVAAFNPPQRSIAVLPFLDLSEKKDQEYFSDGLAEELLDLLAKTSDLHVIARTSSFSFKGKSDDIPAIAAKLNVANILEGSVRKSGNRLRVTAQLIRAANGEHIWSETYDRELKDVFAVQDEVSNAVVSALKVRLAPSSSATTSRTTRSADAYNQYLMGRNLYQKASDETDYQAAAAFRRAVKFDPHYAAAYAALALAEYYPALSAHDEVLINIAFVDADRAIALAPDLADGYQSRGYLRYLYHWDWAGAEADYAEAMRLDPNDVDQQRHYAQLLATLGRLPEAIAVVRKAAAADPLSSITWERLADFLMADGQLAAAREALHQAAIGVPEMVDFSEMLALVELLDGHFDAARGRIAAIQDPPRRAYATALIEYSLGDRAASQLALQQAIELNQPLGSLDIAEIYAWRKEESKALEWLQKSYAEHNYAVSEVGYYPLFAPIRQTAGFKAFLRKLNLPQHSER